MHILFTVLFTFLIELREENLLKYQDILSVLIILFILFSRTFDFAVILLGEI